MLGRTGLVFAIYFVVPMLFFSLMSLSIQKVGIGLEAYKVLPRSSFISVALTLPLVIFLIPAFGLRKAQALWALIKRRAVVVETRKQLQQSLKDVQLAHQSLMTQFKLVLARIDQRIKTLLGELGWNVDYRRCRSIPGIGPVNVAALVCAFHRGSFAGSNAFIAYLGMDIRRRESGQYKGKRKLTKRGESELRRLLYCAAQPARCHARFDDYYQAQIDKRHAKIAAKVILARKLARIAFTLMTRQQNFNKTEIAHSQAP